MDLEAKSSTSISNLLGKFSGHFRLVPSSSLAYRRDDCNIFLENLEGSYEEKILKGSIEEVPSLITN